MEKAWIWAATVVYLVVAVTALLRVFLYRKSIPGGAAWMMTIGLLLQTLGMYQRGMQVGGCPIGNPFEIIQFVIWSCIVMYLVVGPAFRISFMGVFVALLAGPLSLLTLVIAHWDSYRRDAFFGHSPWLEFHASLALFGYGAIALLALTSWMFLLQNRHLKKKRLNGLFRVLPPVLALEEMTFRLLMVAAVLVSVSIAVGLPYFLEAPQVLTYWKTGTTLLVWGSLISMLVLRLRRKLVTERLSIACIVLFFLAILSLIPVNRGYIASSPPAESASVAVFVF